MEYVWLMRHFARLRTLDAPEGFSHQLINIYIDTTKGLGRQILFGKALWLHLIRNTDGMFHQSFRVGRMQGFFVPG